MHVVYDITSLGGGFYNQRSRAGIFRVVESIANQLEDNNECKVHYWANRLFVNMEYATHYLLNSDKYSINKFVYPDSFSFLLLFKLFLKKYPKRKDSIIYRGFRKYLEKNFNKKRNDLLFADIFHSTHQKIPDFKNNKLKRFLTVYDLIPIKFPQFYKKSEGHKNNLIDIYNSIRPDDIIFCISESTKNDFCEFTGIDTEKVVVTPLAASEHFYPVEDKRKIKLVKERYNICDKPYLLSVNTLEPRKNIKNLIKAFTLLLKEKKVQNLNLVLTGTKGWMYDEIFSEANKNKDFKNSIIFTGYVKDEDLAGLYSGAHAFIYPSFYEGFGLPPLEAMQCGLPVITSNNSSLSEVVADAGIVIDPNDVESIAQSIFDIYQNQSLRFDLKKKSIERSKCFNWRMTAEIIVSEYKKALNV